MNRSLPLSSRLARWCYACKQITADQMVGCMVIYPISRALIMDILLLSFKDAIRIASKRLARPITGLVLLYKVDLG